MQKNPGTHSHIRDETLQSLILQISSTIACLYCMYSKGHTPMLFRPLFTGNSNVLVGISRDHNRSGSHNRRGNAHSWCFLFLQAGKSKYSETRP